jgi:hypothetical protein
MTILRRLFSALRTPPAPEIPRPLPAGKLRIHLFCGTFADVVDANDYCFQSVDDAAEALNRDQPGAFIDTAFVECHFGDPIPRLAEFLTPEETDHLIVRIGHHNTLIIISEEAFGGLPYTLEDTDQLTYLGPEIVDV